MRSGGTISFAAAAITVGLGLLVGFIVLLFAFPGSATAGFRMLVTGGFENIGWCRHGTAGIYNIRIMEEMQTVIALGAGGVTKVYYHDENRLERVPNLTNYELYISRLSEMFERKREKLFVQRFGWREDNADKRA